MGKLMIYYRVRKPTIAMLGKAAAAKCYATLSRKVSDGSETGAISGREADRCQYSGPFLPPSSDLSFSQQSGSSWVCSSEPRWSLRPFS